jgi:hypothetical protein
VSGGDARFGFELEQPGALQEQQGPPFVGRVVGMAMTDPCLSSDKLFTLRNTKRSARYGFRPRCEMEAFLLVEGFEVRDVLEEVGVQLAALEGFVRRDVNR